MNQASSISGDPARDPTASPSDRPVLPRHVELPPPPRRKLSTWGLLVVVVGLTLAPLLVELEQPDATRPDECTALLCAQETWMRQTGHWPYLYGWSAANDSRADRPLPIQPDRRAWLIPHLHGRPRLNVPPMAVWMNLLAWHGLNPANSPPQLLVHRARLVGVFITALALAATFWAGYSIGQLRTAGLAVLITGSSFLLVRQGRLATEQTVLMGWVMVAVAAGLWAMRPLKPINWLGRRVSGWVLCGLTLGAAILTAGPVALLYVAWPLVGTIALMPRRRLGNLTGLLFAVMLGVLVAAPWYLFIIQAMPAARHQLLQPAPTGASALPHGYGAGLLYMVCPWTIWLLGALCQPWLRARGQYRRQLLIAWLWLVGLAVFTVVLTDRHERWFYMLMPAAGLMTAQLWTWHGNLADQRCADPGVNLLRLPHWLALAGLSVLLLPAWWRIETVNAWLARQFGLAVDLVRLAEPLPAWLVVPWAVLLLGLCLAGIRWHWRWKPVHAAVVTALWSLLLMTVACAAWSHSPLADNPARPLAANLARTIGRYPLRHLAGRPIDNSLSDGLLFYLRRVVEPLHVQHLDEYARRPAFLLVDRLTERHAVEQLEQLHYQHITDLADRSPGGTVRQLALYRSPATAPRTGQHPSSNPQP